MNSPPLHYALGLSLVRQQDYDKALEYFKNANTLSPEDGQIAMVYAIALNTMEMSDEAIDLLNNYLQEYSENSQITTTLTTLYRDTGQIDKAIEMATRLVQLMPGDQQANNLLQQLRDMEE